MKENFTNKRVISKESINKTICNLSTSYKMNLYIINNNNNSANIDHDITKINSDEEYAEKKLNAFKIKLIGVQILYM